MYPLSQLRKDNSMSVKLSKQFKKDISAYRHKIYKNWVIHLKGKYFTEFLTGQLINVNMLRIKLRFDGKMPELYDIEKKEKGTLEDHGKRHRKAISDPCREMAKDIIDYGYKGKKSCFISGE